MNVWKLVAEMPSTNVRISATILLSLMTGVRVVWLGWVPSIEWLGFLVVMSGLDAGTYLGKRATNMDYVAAKQNGTTAEMKAVSPQGGQ
ncbi:MAG TPA: hypothetical protein VJP78_15495 [Thermoleophilia bacterium]|nr:hypothetical protein [Thermoleophilia bacterium]